MDNIVFSSVDLPLKVSQIVCLEHQNSKLYGEVIQLIPHRKLCWFRPLCLLISADAQNSLNTEPIERSPSATRSESFRVPREKSPEAKFSQQSGSDLLWQDSADYGKYTQDKLIDLQSGSDLLWPDSLFRPALDTEIIFFLPQLKDISHHWANKRANQKYLTKFIHSFWQAHQDRF